MGFDDVRFGILVDVSSGAIADWESAPIVTERHIPGTNRVDIHVMGYGLATVTWRLEFDCPHQYQALRMRLGTVGTLTLVAGLQSHPGTEITRLDRVYEQLPNTRLATLTRLARYPDGTIEVDATFKRAFDPITGTSEVS